MPRNKLKLTKEQAITALKIETTFFLVACQAVYDSKLPRELKETLLDLYMAVEL